MPTRTISITDEAYSRLKALKMSKKDSFSDVILKYYPKKRRLSEILAVIGPNADLADAIERSSRELRQTPSRKTGL